MEKQPEHRLTDDELVDECYRVMQTILNYPVVVMRVGHGRLRLLLKELERRKQLELPLDYGEDNPKRRF